MEMGMADYLKEWFLVLAKKDAIALGIAFLSLYLGGRFFEERARILGRSLSPLLLVTGGIIVALVTFPPLLLFDESSAQAPISAQLVWLGVFCFFWAFPILLGGYHDGKENEKNLSV